jgi:phosphomannomutase
VEDAFVVVARDGRASGHGFVTFASAAALDAAVKVRLVGPARGVCCARARG